MIPLEKLFDLVPPELLDRLAVQYRVNTVNQIRLKGQLVFLCLLNLTVNHPKLTQRLLEDTYRKLTGQTADHSSFGKRLATLPPEYFEALFRHICHAVKSQITRGTQQALRLRIVDSTTVVLSAKVLAFGIQVSATQKTHARSGKRHVKSVLTLSEEGLPDFLHVCREQREANENPALGEPMIAATQPGDLWVVDAGLADRERLWQIHDRGGHFIVPQERQQLRVVETVWEAPSAPEAAAASAPPVPALPDGTGGRLPPPCRLQRVEQVVFENSADQQSAKKREHWEKMPLLAFVGERWDSRAHLWKPWVLLVSLPLSPDRQHAGPYTFGEIPELYRRRWEIETFFKFLKQYLSYAHLTSRCENGIRVMIWMALITAVVLIWYQKESGIDRGWRSVKFWLAEEVRAWTQELLTGSRWLQILPESG